MDLNGTQITSGIAIALMLLLMVHRLIVADLPRKGALWMVLLWALIVVVITVAVLLLRCGA
ncbi:MAG: hypothetical protein JWR77_122 [Rhizorhabdus sp.]|nr:hypothetical protein [Rhizorhabdus sp.]